MLHFCREWLPLYVTEISGIGRAIRFGVSLAWCREFKNRIVNCCNFCVVLSPIIVSGNSLVFFSTWKEPSEEALVMAITLYYIIDGSC